MAASGTLAATSAFNLALPANVGKKRPLPKKYEPMSSATVFGSERAPARKACRRGAPP